MTQCLRLENRHTGEVLVMRRVERDGIIGLALSGSLPPGRSGPPLHAHFVEDEVGRVTAGVLGAEVGGERREIPAGQAVTLPRGVPHRWWNAGEEILTFEGTLSPLVDLDCYLQAMFEVMNAGPEGRPPLIYLAHVALRHRHTQAAYVLPGMLQAVVFRLAVTVGTLLGRYAGTGWPGCPARCQGAPGAGADGA